MIKLLLLVFLAFVAYSGYVSGNPFLMGIGGILCCAVLATGNRQPA